METDGEYDDEGGEGEAMDRMFRSRRPGNNGEDNRGDDLMLPPKKNIACEVLSKRTSVGGGFLKFLTSCGP